VQHLCRRQHELLSIIAWNHRWTEIKPCFDTHNPQSAQSPKFISNLSKFQFWWIVVFAHADDHQWTKKTTPPQRAWPQASSKHTLWYAPIIFIIFSKPVCNNIGYKHSQTADESLGHKSLSHCYPTRPVDVKLWSCWTVQQRAKHKLRDRSQVIPNEKCSEKHDILMNPVISPKYTGVLQIPHPL
jgi:hypothetical protein